MRKIFLLFVALLATTALWAYDFKSGGLYYNITSDTTVEVTYYWAADGYGYYETSITIPSQINYNNSTYDVTRIGNGAFIYSRNLTSISIPNSVKSIESNAFIHCSSLKSITIPNGVTTIGLMTFLECVSLSSITLPNSVTSIGQSAFDNCKSLTSIALPNNITNIGHQAFNNCTSLTSIIIPKSVTNIDNSAFKGCVFTKNNFVNNSALNAEENNYWGATIVNATEEINGLFIEDQEVIGCRPNLTKIVIPRKITKIGDYAFSNSSAIKSIICCPGNVPLVTTSCFDTATYDKSYLYVPFETITNYKTDTVWGQFKNIQYIDTFYYDAICYEYIETENCFSKSLFVKADAETFRTISVVGNQKWRYDSKYGVTMSGYSDSDQKTYQNEDWLISPAIDMSKYKLATLTFSHAFGPKAQVPTSSSQKAQYTCWVSNDYNGDVTTATWTELPITYGTSAWSFITTDVDIPAEHLKENCHIAWKYVCVNSSATWEIESVKINGEYIKPQVKVISGQNNLNEITIPSVATNNNVDYVVSAIEKNAFVGHSFLTSITIPSSVTKIGERAFYECSSLTSINIPNSITSIGDNAFSYCSSLISVMWNVKHAKFNDSGKTPFSYCDNIEVFTFGDSVKHIPDMLCYGMNKLTSITIPNSVTSIGDFAFFGCDALTSVTIPNSVTSIGDFTFSGCDALTSVTIPNSISEITKYLFYDCLSLNEITLPSSIKSIGENAFAGCTKLYDIYCFAMEPPTAYESSFANYNAFLHVPCDNQRVYLLDVLFGNFKYIECIEAETTPTDTVVVTPSFNDAEFIWPSNSSADSYTLAISKDGEVFCTLTFNANGQLTGIAFAPSRSGQHHIPAAAQTANGYAFTVTGLDEGSNYTYDLLIQDRSGNTLQSYSGEFRTQSTNDRTVTVEYDATQGQITGAGTYLVGDTVTLTAIPNDGYRFVRWSNEVEENPYTFVISDNVTLSAEFEAVIPSSLENTNSQSPMSNYQKIIRDGQLLILRDGKTYNVMGAEIQ